MAITRTFDTDAVLDQVVDLFWQHGFDGVAMQDVCAATGLNPGSLYAAFGDKQGMFVQAMQRYIQSVSQQAIERLHRQSSAMAGIRDYFAARWTRWSTASANGAAWSRTPSWLSPPGNPRSLKHSGCT